MKRNLKFTAKSESHTIKGTIQIETKNAYMPDFNLNVARAKNRLYDMLRDTHNHDQIKIV